MRYKIFSSRVHRRKGRTLRDLLRGTDTAQSFLKRRRLSSFASHRSQAKRRIASVACIVSHVQQSTNNTMIERRCLLVPSRFTTFQTFRSMAARSVEKGLLFSNPATTQHAPHAVRSHKAPFRSEGALSSQMFKCLTFSSAKKHGAIGAVAAHSACAGWRHRQADTKFFSMFQPETHATNTNNL